MKYLHGISGIVIAALIWITIMSLAIYHFPDGAARVWALLGATGLGVIILWLGDAYGAPAGSTPPDSPGAKAPADPTKPTSLV